MQLDDSWIGVDFFTDENVPGIIRFRPNLQNFMEAGIHDRRLDIIWTYETYNDSLLPEPAELDLMTSVEDALVNIFEQDNQTILAFVLTGENERWWAWYTTDIDMAGERLNAALAQFDELPISISVTDDREWSEYNAVLDDFEEEE